MRIRSICRAVVATLAAIGMVTAAAPAAHAVPPAPTIDRSGLGDAGTDASGYYVQVYFAGQAQASSIVRVYGNSSCTGAAIGEDQADSYGHWGVEVTARPGQTVTGFANATDGTGPSACSTTTGTYTLPPVPDTKFKKTPKKVTRYSPSSEPDGHYVKFTYKATTKPVLYRCTLDKKPIACPTSGRINLLVKLGKHTFTVAAYDEKVRTFIDQTPAKFTFRLKNKN